MRDMTDQSHHFQSIRDGIGRLWPLISDSSSRMAGLLLSLAELWRKATSRPLQPISSHHRKSLHYLLRLPRECKECEKEQWSCSTKDGLLLNWRFHPRSGVSTCLSSASTSLQQFCCHCYQRCYHSLHTMQTAWSNQREMLSLSKLLACRQERSNNC